MIRFASIPKAASRTLKVQGLLGETDAAPHMRIREFPEWERYAWHVVMRDRASWLASWWHEAKKAPGPFSEAIGMKFEDIAADLARLESPPHVAGLPKGEGAYSWIPSDFFAAYAPHGGDFHAFCYATIMDSVPCTPIPIESLSTWLTGNGFKPFHLNARIP